MYVILITLRTFSTRTRTLSPNVICMNVLVGLGGGSDSDGSDGGYDVVVVLHLHQLLLIANA